MKEVEKPKVITEDDQKKYFLGSDTPPDSETLRRFGEALKLIDFINQLDTKEE